MSNNDDDTLHYRVVVNHRKQYSLWAAHRDIPHGWEAVGVAGSREACLDYIESVWLDMAPFADPVAHD